MRIRAYRTFANFVLITCFALVRLLRIAHAAPSSSPTFSGTIIPCDSCGKNQIKIIDTKSHASIQASTTMNEISNIYSNSAGNVIVVGVVGTSITDVLIVNQINGEKITEFWTVTFGISPDYSRIAYTEFVAPHGRYADYSDTMVYVLDARTKRVEAEDGSLPSVVDTPVFPAALAKYDRRYLLRIPSQKLDHVISTDFLWNGLSGFSFVVAKSSGKFEIARLGPSLSGDWSQPRLTSGVPFNCDFLGTGERDVGSIIKACGQ